MSNWRWMVDQVYSGLMRVGCGGDVSGEEWCRTFFDEVGERGSVGDRGRVERR